MSRMKFLLLGLLLIPVLSFAQEMFQFLSPATPTTSIGLEGLYLPVKEVEGGRNHTQVLHSSASLQQNLYKSEKDSFSVGAKSEKLDLARGSYLLRDYYNQQGSLAWKRQKGGDDFWLATISFGSASDRPFKDSRDSTLGANFIKKFNSRWVGLLNYSNNRTFLNNVPLPGLFYIKEMTSDRALIIGFPVLFWMTPVMENWSFKYLGILPWVHNLKLSYKGIKGVEPYLQFEQTPQSFFHHDREDRKDRIFWFERRLGVGLEGRLTKSLRFDLSGGLSFDREIFESQNFSDEKDFLLNMDNSFFTSLKIRLNL